MTLNAEEQPLKVDVLNGEVVMTGPRVAIALQPGAATETARRLVAAADLAVEQTGTAIIRGLDRPASNDLR
jgi:hypothetical protein